MLDSIGKTFWQVYDAIGRLYLTPLLRKEWKTPPKRMNERAIELAFVSKWLARLYPEEVLDVGTGATVWPRVLANCGFRVTAIDEMQSYWQRRFFNRYFFVLGDDITKPRISKTFDMITCISVLEHIRDHQAAMRGIFGLLKPGGHALLTFPYNEGEYVEDAYSLPGAGYNQGGRYICQVFSRNEIDGWLEENPATIVEQEYYQIFTGDMWTFGERIYPPRLVAKDEKHHLTCLLLQKT